MASLEIIVHKVGAGHAVHIFTPANEVIVLDTGSSDDFSPLDWLYEKRKRTHIDHLIISHPHGDHIREIDKVKRFTVGVLSCPRNLDEATVRAANQGWCKELLDEYFKLDRGFRNPVTSPMAGSSSGVQVETFFDPGDARSNLNNFSLVASITYGPWTIVLPGDNEASSWKALAANATFAARLKRCQIFLASHHGRESGYCGETLPKFLNPMLCVISDGKVRDTDASAKYGARASGMNVTHGSGKIEKRAYVATRSDGYVQATFEQRTDNTYATVKVPNG